MSAIMVGVMVAPAGAAPKAKNTQISGTGEFVATCNGETSLFTIELTPATSGWGLDGCWYTTGIVDKKANPNGTYQERGTETFVGSLTYNGVAIDDGVGEFDTTYLFSAKFTPDYLTEIHGRSSIRSWLAVAMGFSMALLGVSISRTMFRPAPSTTEDTSRSSRSQRHRQPRSTIQSASPTGGSACGLSRP